MEEQENPTPPPPPRRVTKTRLHAWLEAVEKKAAETAGIPVDKKEERT